MGWMRSAIVGLAAVGYATCALAGGSPDTGGTKAQAEQAIRAYLAQWSSDGHFDAGAVARFYAPLVVYYGKTFSREQVLRDKQSYVRQWPIRHYAEVPGSLSASCDPSRTICRVSVLMRWRRVSIARRVSTGQARMAFDFVPVEGSRKIARESARIVSGGA